MSVEIGQMVVKTKVAENGDGGREDADAQAAGFEPADLELLKQDVLDACRRMIAETLRDRKER